MTVTPPLSPLAAYDADRYGPLLGVSDEGSAVQPILSAAALCAKAAVAERSDPEVVGLIIDGERMTSGGEAPIGPPQYDAIASAALGRLYCTTNVSIRVASRLDRLSPELPAPTDAQSAEASRHQLERTFERFVKTPDGVPRRLVVRLVLPREPDKPTIEAIAALVQMIDDARADGLIGDRHVHRLALLVQSDGPLASDDGPARVERAIELAARLRIDEVAVDGPLELVARRRLGVQGVLNVLPPLVADRLLRSAAKAGIALVHRYDIDEPSAAVGVWVGIHTAATRGLAGAKYGLTPLTFDEQQQLVSTVQPWVRELTAIPAFYVDTPLVTNSEVYLSDRAADALRLWLEMVHAHGVEVVLVDAPDRHLPRIDASDAESPRRLLKLDGDDTPGALDLRQVEMLVSHAKGLGIRILWSGGITAAAAFSLGRLGVFGIFTTSSTAMQVPVGPVLADDPYLPVESEPTKQGVRKVHALLQAGFLAGRLDDKPELVEELTSAAGDLIERRPDDEEFADALGMVDAALVRGWRIHWAQCDEVSGA